ncbi:MAG: lipid-transfer protein [Alphaproteobacteria bacterium]|jgi:acetyl-CoA acetyltransferase|nr:lipid-transfer protein [Rhodospirillaceae bacterium]MDP6403938.1 lipid-transfer protein [Alphaproteobacteria bacterium]MDP6622708.1 lipid-transfer protein [Alphaproteobacteria bacterium]|tara:strand:+ start:679 stop:1857 length:1179 start_codon:yes stop_codon:yes gene_type:complete
MTNVHVAGVGMIPFVKPGQSEPYAIMGAEAARLALSDAGLDYAQVQQAYAGFVYGDSTCGQAALYNIGLTGIPIVNVNNNCSTGSTALFLARQAVASGTIDCALAVGFEQMNPGALGAVFDDRPNPLSRFTDSAEEINGPGEAPITLRLFGALGDEYKTRHGARDETFAKVRAKASQHAEHNERAIFRTPLSVEEVMASPRMSGMLTRLQCCPPTCGAAAAVVCSESFAKRHGLDTSVVITGQAMTSDFPSTFENRSMRKLVGADLASAAAQQVFAEAGVGPEDVDVVELHDCFTTNEVITYESLGLAAEGEAEKFVWDGDNTYGGRVVTNPSGGLLSKGHPLGATGLAQCFELVSQLRGQSGARQVEGARTALQHNLGLGSACVVTMYQKA